MNQLQRQTRLDAFGGEAAPGEQQIPGSQAEMFGNQQPQAQVGTADLVRQQLPDSTFQARRVTRFGADLQAGALGCQLRFSLRSAAMQFFFEGRSR
jgi:hypothetical protein